MSEEEKGIKTATSLIPQEHLPTETKHTDSTSLAELEQLELNIKRTNKILTIAAMNTSERDWIDEAGNPYLQSSGCEKIARCFGVCIADVSIDCENFEDDKGKYYVYTVFGTASSQILGSIEAIGTCSSRDKFFGKARGEWRDIADIDRTNIKKKAYTNFFGNAIRKLIGLNNMTWDDLGVLGISKKGKAQVARNTKEEPASKGGGGGNASSPSPSTEKPPFWDKKFDDGGHKIFARSGRHFPAQFLFGIGMLESNNTNGLFWADYSDRLAGVLAKTAEEGFADEPA